MVKGVSQVKPVAPVVPPTPTPQATMLAGNAAILNRQKILHEDLQAIEKQIYNIEGQYIEETNTYGNVVKGWDGYVSSKPKLLHAGSRKIKYSDKDRLFSHSSITSPNDKTEFGDDDDYEDDRATNLSRNRKRSRAYNSDDE